MSEFNDTNDTDQHHAFNGINGVVAKENPLAHYQWGNQCDGWNLVDESSLSVKLERMPAYTAEQIHFHQQAQQFFYILKGKAIFEIEERRLIVKANHGIHIRAGQKHRVINESDVELEFLLSSQPSAAEDRINC